MNSEEPIAFYSSKPRLVHMAINIALAPALLYLVSFWPWPPTTPHYITFGITGLIGMRYARLRWHQPRLVINHEGIYCGAYYSWNSIRNLQTVMRALKVMVVLEDGRVKEKVLNLGWASNADFKRIIEVITDHYQRYANQ